MTIKHWILVGETPIETTMEEWSSWFEKGERVVQQDYIARKGLDKEILVSTVFLGIDHGWLPSRIPILFESMIFDDPLNEELQWRYASYRDAWAGHILLKEAVLRGVPAPDQP